MVKRIFTGFLILLLIVQLSLFCSYGAFANGVHLPSVGPVSTGRGGTNISHTDNGVLILDNPAGLVNMEEGIHIDVDSEFIFPEIKYEDAFDSDYSKHKIFIIPTLSLVYKRSSESKFAFGAGAFAPAGFGTEYHLTHFSERRLTDNLLSFGKEVYNSGASLLKVLFSASYKVNDKLSLGFSAGPSFQNVEFKMPYTLETGKFAGVTGIADAEGSDSYKLSYTAGIQYQLSERTRFGLSFVSESKATIRGEGDLTLPVVGPNGNILAKFDSEYDLKTNTEWPRLIGFGVTHRTEKFHRFSLELVWYGWRSAFDSLDIELTDGNNKFLNRVIGSTVNDEYILGWDDAFAFKFGYEYFLNGSENNIFRAGYLYNENPDPHGSQTPLIPGAMQHNVTVGYTHKREKWKFDVASQFYTGDTNNVHSNKIAGGDWDNSSIKTRVFVLIFGVSYSF